MSGARWLHRFFRGAVVWRHGVFPELHAGALARYEGASADAQRARSFERLQAVVRHAYETVPYYRERFDEAGAHPETLRSAEDLARFPILEKQDVIRHRETLCIPGAPLAGPDWDATGGSTGEPMRFLRSRHSTAVMYANEARTWRWYGVAPGARLANVWGADRDVSPDESALSLKNRLLGVCQLNAFLVDDERCRRFSELLEEFRPEIIYGYATALARFATYRQEHGLAPLPVKAVRSTAEVLLPEHRERIEQGFDGPLYDYYGSREAGPIAGELPDGEGLHVFSDVTHVEIVDEAGEPCPPGQVGDLVVTKLHEFDMPFIRYRIGDRSAFLPGPGRFGLPRITPLEGRVGDFVLAPGGRAIHGEFFTHLFYGVAGVHRFQVRQPEPDRLRILVEGEGVPGTELERIRAASAEHFGGEVSIEEVAEIRPGNTGKHRFVLPYDGSGG